jgi:hypothetical protein
MNHVYDNVSINVRNNVHKHLTNHTKLK